MLRFSLSVVKARAKVMTCLRIMLFRFTLFYIILFSACSGKTNEYSINSKGQNLTVSLVRGDINYLQCQIGDSITSSWPLRYPVYKFLKGDVNNDGQEDIAVGVIKSTRYDSVARKRLFLFQVRNKAIIPLWLGSSLGHPLEDFAIRAADDSVIVIRSVEKENNDHYLVAEYEWYGFGLSFRKYIKRELTLTEAQELLSE